MDAVSKTLYIPLYGKAEVSRNGIILNDPKAEEIWAAEGFELRGKSKSKWLAYYMGMRSAVIDELASDALTRDPDAVALHIGCGLDSRALRVGAPYKKWYDIDLADVIDVRRRFYRDGERYLMLAGDASRPEWLAAIPESESAVIVMEGLSMYLGVDELKALFEALAAHFETAFLITDAYTELAARAYARANPINAVGASVVSGLDDPLTLETSGGFKYLARHSMTPDDKIAELNGLERLIFKTVYAGVMSDKLYRLYAYEKR